MSKTYYTKCGIVFKKSTKAEVTGYQLTLLPTATDPLKVKDDIERVECRTCPFVMLVEEGYPKPVFKRFECRAGSQKPNHKTEWVGRLDDKNTISINSLDHQRMEEILQYCKDQPDLNASYNTDHLADCRRTLSISCSANKKGITAKKEIIEKFFNDKKSDSIDQINKMWKDFMKCGACDHAIDCESVEYRKCKLKKRRVSINQVACNNFESTEQEPEEVKQDCTTPTRACGKCNAGHWYSGENTYVSVVADDGIKTTKRPCEPHIHYCYQFTEGQKKIASAKDFNPDTAPEWCPLEKDIKYTYEADAQGTTDTHVCIDDPEWEDKWIGTSEKKKPRIGTESGCTEIREDCPCFCSHNDGCSVLLVRGSALKSVIKNIYSKYDIDCDVYKKTLERVNGTPEIDTQVPEIANDLAEIDTKSVETVTFDYSTLGVDTADTSTLDGNLSFILRKCKDIVNNYIEIGYSLIDIKNKKLFKDRGYDNLIDCVEAELNMKKSSVYNFIKIAEKFGDPETKNLKAEYSQYNYAQCIEMSTMTKDELNEINPDMSKRDMQEMKKSNRLEKSNVVVPDEKNQSIKDNSVLGDNVIDIVDYKVVSGISNIQTIDQAENNNSDNSSSGAVVHKIETNNNQHDISSYQVLESEQDPEANNITIKIDSEFKDELYNDILMENENYRLRVERLEQERRDLSELVRAIDKKFNSISKKQIRNCIADYITTGQIMFEEN